MPVRARREVGTLALVALVKRLEERIAAAERGADKGTLKRITENAGVVALFLGLVLSIASLYDVLWAKPKAERISALAQFNQAVNSAAKTQQEVAVASIEKKEAAFAIMEASTPRILNDVGTARALLAMLADEDVGIPQLVILIGGAYMAGDLDSAKVFVDRATRIPNLNPYMRSEALRHEGRFHYRNRSPAEGAAAFERALAVLDAANQEAIAGVRAYLLLEFATTRFAFGDCSGVEPTLRRFAEILRSSGLTAQERYQFLSALPDRIRQSDTGRCPPPDLGAILAMGPVR